MSFHDIEINYELPEECKKDHKLEAAIQSAAQKLWKETSGLGENAIERGEVTATKEGKGLAVTFRVRFFNTQNVCLSSHYTKLYSKTLQASHQDECSRMEKTRATLKTDLFASEFVNLHNCSGFYGIAYPDAEFQMGAEAISFQEWVNTKLAGIDKEDKLPSNLSADLEFLRSSLFMAFKSLNSLDSPDVRAADRSGFSFFQDSWHPHFEFESPTFVGEAGQETIFVSIDGVRVADDKCVALDAKELMEAACSISSNSQRALKATIAKHTDEDDRYIFRNGRFTFRIQMDSTPSSEDVNMIKKCDHIVIGWRENGPNTKTFGQHIHRLQECAGEGLPTGYLDAVPHKLYSEHLKNKLSNE